MSLVETFLFIMILVTLFNGFIFFRMLIKLQKRNNELLKMLLEKERNNDRTNEGQKIKQEIKKERDK